MRREHPDFITGVHIELIAWQCGFLVADADFTPGFVSSCQVLMGVIAQFPCACKLRSSIASAHTRNHLLWARLAAAERAAFGVTMEGIAQLPTRTFAPDNLDRHFALMQNLLKLPVC